MGDFQSDLRATSGLLEADPPTVSIPWILHCLYSLDTSSLDFLRNLYSLFRHDEEELCLTNLRGTEPARLMDSLDGVCTFPSAFHQLTKQTPQTLSIISANRDVSRQCLRKLQEICSHRLEQSLCPNRNPQLLSRSQNMCLFKRQHPSHQPPTLCHPFLQNNSWHSPPPILQGSPKRPIGQYLPLYLRSIIPISAVILGIHSRGF